MGAKDSPRSLQDTHEDMKQAKASFEGLSQLCRRTTTPTLAGACPPRTRSHGLSLLSLLFLTCSVNEASQSDGVADGDNVTCTAPYCSHAYHENTPWLEPEAQVHQE